MENIRGRFRFNDDGGIGVRDKSTEAEFESKLHEDEEAELDPLAKAQQIAKTARAQIEALGLDCDISVGAPPAPIDKTIAANDRRWSGK